MWIEEPIHGDVVGMHFRRMIWREVGDMLAANPEVGEQPSSFWDFYIENYATTQAVAVRRQADRDEGACSLARLIEEMRDDAPRLTREYFVGLWHDQRDPMRVQMANAAFDPLAGDVGVQLDPEVPKRDLAALRSDAAAVRKYVNEHVAHDTAEPTTTETPTYDDMHAAIDSMGRMFKKYAHALTASTYVTLEPVIQDDWQAIFRRPWLSGND